MDETSAAQLRVAEAVDLAALIECDQYSQHSVTRRSEIDNWLTTRSLHLLEADGHVAGFIVLEYSFFGYGFIPLVVVHPKSRRKGIGLMLLAFAQAACRTSKLFTSTNESNHAARCLFARAGFVPSGTIENLDDGEQEFVYYRAIRAKTAKRPSAADEVQQAVVCDSPRRLGGNCMDTPSILLRSIAGLALAFFGSVVVAIGIYLVFASIASALTEAWGDHGSGLSLLIYGLLLALPGAFAIRLGLRICRAASSAR